MCVLADESECLPRPTENYDFVSDDHFQDIIIPGLRVDNVVKVAFLSKKRNSRDQNRDLKYSCYYSSLLSDAA